MQTLQSALQRHKAQDTASSNILTHRSTCIVSKTFKTFSSKVSSGSICLLSIHRTAAAAPSHLPRMQICSFQEICTFSNRLHLAERKATLKTRAIWGQFWEPDHHRRQQQTLLRNSLASQLYIGELTIQ